MALTGVHVVFGGWRGVDGGSLLPTGASLSQVMTSSAVSKSNPSTAASLLSISASAAIYFITGPNLSLSMLTDGVTPARYYDPSVGGQPENIIVNGGDQVAWAFA
jgi:hypothetical protein